MYICLILKTSKASNNISEGCLKGYLFNKDLCVMFYGWIIEFNESHHAIIPY